MQKLKYSIENMIDKTKFLFLIIIHITEWIFQRFESKLSANGKVCVREGIRESESSRYDLWQRVHTEQSVTWVWETTMRIRVGFRNVYRRWHMSFYTPELDRTERKKQQSVQTQPQGEWTPTGAKNIWREYASRTNLSS